MLGIVHWVIKVSTITMLAGKGCCFASLDAEDDEDDEEED